jgi:hypothetical protein
VVDGIYNAGQLWQYTNLQGGIIRQIRRIIHESPTDRLPQQVFSLIDSGKGWRLVDFFPELTTKVTVDIWSSLNGWRRKRQNIKHGRSAPKSVHTFAKSFRKRWPPTPQISRTAFSDSIQAIVAGCQFLQQGEPDRALGAFEQAREIGTLREMEQLTTSLSTLCITPNLLDQGPILRLMARPPNARRGASWDALDHLKRAYHYYWLHQHCEKIDLRGWTSDMANRLLDPIDHLVLPQPEATLLRAIVSQWRGTADRIIIGGNSRTCYEL